MGAGSDGCSRIYLAGCGAKNRRRFCASVSCAAFRDCVSVPRVAGGSAASHDFNVADSFWRSTGDLFASPFTVSKKATVSFSGTLLGGGLYFGLRQIVASKSCTSVDSKGHRARKCKEKVPCTCCVCSFKVRRLLRCQCGCAGQNISRNVQPNVQLGFSVRTFYRRSRSLAVVVVDRRDMLNKC